MTLFNWRLLAAIILVLVVAHLLGSCQMPLRTFP